MSEALDHLQPAAARDVNVYLPYYPGNKRTLLPLAIALYQSGALEGQRGIEAGESIPFVATWSISSLPADLIRCRVQFEGTAELSYEVTIANFEFIGFLIEVVTNFKHSRLADFPKGFYQELLRMQT
ncbi:MAG TPA: type IV pilus biogenesis protein EbsA [Candidatus Caenarcaniphilales bacterium]